MSLHIFGPGFSTFVRSVRLYCAEKGLDPSHGMTLDGTPVNLQDARHLALHPFGKLPVLIHGGRRVFETTSICRYLDAAFPESSLQPADAGLRAEVDQWSAALALYADTCLVRRYILPLAGPKRARVELTPRELAHAQAEANAMLTLLERQLDGREYFCGARYSMADALLTPMLDYLRHLPDGLQVASALAAYAQRMGERPSARVLRE